jgi:hypothetical protein
MSTILTLLDSSRKKRISMRRKLQLAFTVLMILSSSIAWGKDVDVKTSSTVKDWCSKWVALESTPRVSAVDASDAGMCLGYIMGIMEQVAINPIPETQDQPDGTVKPTGKFFNWSWGQAVTPDQIARVFVKFVKDSPEWLDKPAYLAIETACMKDGLLIAGKPDFLPNYTSVPNDGKHPIK